MAAGAWQFRPGRWPTAAFAVVFPLLLALGFWQVQRAAQKEAIHAAYLARSQAAPVDLAALGPERADAEAMRYRRVKLRGRYRDGVNLLLDNRVHDGAPGYEVFTPLVFDDGTAVLVNRGWVSGGLDRGRTPAITTPGGAVEETGIAKAAPVTPVLKEAPPETLAPGLYRLQQIKPGDVAGMLHDTTLLPYVVRLDPGGGELVRLPFTPGSGKRRHQGYAFQWFALAGLLLVIYVAVNLKRRDAQ